MPDPRPLSAGELAGYLARIDIARAGLHADLATLRRLQTAHMAAIPFENGDVQLGLVPSMEPDAIFAKLVTRRRGGWCYEQNGLFGRALAALGFSVLRVAGAVLREARPEVAPGTHLALVVRIEGADWLADVGFGGGIARPLPLAPMASDERPLPHALSRTADHWWRFTVELPNGPLYYDFERSPADEAVLARACHWQSTAADSIFVQSLVVQQRKGGAHRVLRGRTFSVTDAQGTHSHAIGSAGELAALLQETFNLVLPEPEAIWDRFVAREAAQALPAT